MSAHVKHEEAPPPAPAAVPAVVAPSNAASSQDVARLLKQYPGRASLIGQGGITLFGEKIVQRESDGKGGSRVVAVSQKFRLADGSILPLAVE